MKIFITGIAGLIGSTLAEVAHKAGYKVVGCDNDNRGRWFGRDGSVEWRIRELTKLGITVYMRDFRICLDHVQGCDLVVHCASQPSHDFSRSHAIEDSAINYTGTVQLLEAVRKLAPNAVFAFLSTNKVYGDRINRYDFRVEGERFVPTQGAMGGFHPTEGISESFPIDDSLHTPFGVSKTAADLMVQEYRRTFGLKTVSFRCGCLTGKSGTAVELQGFLGYLVKCAVTGNRYVIYGHDGYQVRDNIDAEDVASAILTYADHPKGGIYNLGGGPANSISVREAITYLKLKYGMFPVEIGAARLGDHRWWVTDNRKFMADYPEWSQKKTVWDTIDEMVSSQSGRREAARRDAALPASPLQA